MSGTRWLVLVLAAVTAFGAALTIVQAAAQPLPLPAPTLVATVQLPENGFAVSVNPLNGAGYVGMTSDAGVFGLDSYQYSETIQLYTSGSYAVFPVAVNYCTNRLYTNSKVVNLATREVKSLPCGGDDITINPMTNIIYLGYDSIYQNKPSVVCIVNGATNTKIKSIELGYSIYFENVWVAANPVTNKVYATYTGDDELHVIDGATYTETAVIPVANIGRVAVNWAANRVYVVSGLDTLVLDGDTLAEVGRIEDFSSTLLVNPFTNRIYSLNINVKVADGETNMVVDTVDLPAGAAMPALDPLRGRIYLANAFPASWETLTVVQDIPAPPTATLDCPVVWPVYLPVVGRGE